MDMQKAMSENVTLERAAALSGYDAKNHQVTLSFASDEPYTRWGETEILRCTDENMDYHRFNEGVMVALFNHDRDCIIGKPVKMWCEGNRAKAVMQFATTEKAKEIEQLVADGVLKGVSVGYVVHEYTYLDEKSEKYGYKGPAYIAEKWEVLEFSLVSVPADPTVGVGRSKDNKPQEPDAPKNAEPKAAPADNSLRKEDDKMDDKKVQELVTAAMAKEHARCTELNAMCDKYGIDNKTRSAWLGDADMTVEKATAFVLEKQAAENAALRNANAQNTKVTKDEGDKVRAAMSDAILLRAGVDLTKPAEGADEMRGMSLQAMAMDCLLRAGETNVMRMTQDEVFKRAMTTGQFANIIDLTAKVSMAKAFMEQETTYERWCNTGSLPDFKTTYRYRVSDAPEPELIPENGEFTHADVSGTTYGIKLDTQGIAWSFTRQAFVNDDLDIFVKMPRKFAAAFKRKINALAYAALAGATYNGTNKNLGTAGTVSTTTVAEARKLLRKLKDTNGTPLNFSMKYLIIPTMYEQVAEELMMSSGNPSAAHSGVANVFRNGAEIVCDSALDAVDEYAWYIMANKNQIDGVEIDYLNGKKEPTLEAQNEFDILGRSYRMYMDFGVKAITNAGGAILGVVKNAGH